MTYNTSARASARGAWLPRAIIPAALVLGFAPMSAWSTSYYVSNSGSNNNNGTSVTSPFQTIQKAIEAAVAGDTVYIRAGTYREQVSAWKNAGSAGKYITVTGYNGEVPVLKGSDVVTGWTQYSGNIWKRSNWTINSQQVFVDYNDAAPGKPLQQIGMPNSMYSTYEYPKPVGSGVSSMVAGSFYYDAAGLALYVWLPDGSDPNQHRMEVSTRARVFEMKQPYIYLKGLAFRHSTTSTFVKQGSGVEMTSNSVIDQCDIQSMDFGGVGMGYQQTNAQLINSVVSNNGDVGVNAPASWNFRVAGVHMNGNNYRNFYQFWHAGGIKAASKAYGTVEFSEVAYNNASGIWFDYANGGSQIVIRNNYIHDNGPVDAGIFLEVSNSAQVYNNVIANNTRRGIYVSASDNNNVYNNTVYGVSGYAGIEVGGMPRSGATLTNNKVYNNLISNGSTKYDLIVATPNGTDIVNNTSDYNNFYRPAGGVQLFLGSLFTDLTAWKTATKQDAHSLNSNPTFAGTTATDATRFQLASTSPLVDKATTLSVVPNDYVKTPRPAAAAYDIGAFEYTSGTTTTSSTTTKTADTTFPTATVNTPSTDGTKVSGSVYVSASATDNVGVVQMRIYIDNVLKSQSAKGSIAYPWSTSGMVSGSTHYIMATAADAAGNLTKVTRKVYIK